MVRMTRAPSINHTRRGLSRLGDFLVLPDTPSPLAVTPNAHYQRRDFRRSSPVGKPGAPTNHGVPLHPLELGDRPGKWLGVNGGGRGDPGAITDVAR